MLPATSSSWGVTRRSGATNMYLAGIPSIAIMKVTGHKTEREFMKYIKITEEQTTLELMSHLYFSGSWQVNENLEIRQLFFNFVTAVKFTAITK